MRKSLKALHKYPLPSSAKSTSATASPSPSPSASGSKLKAASEVQSGSKGSEGQSPAQIDGPYIDLFLIHAPWGGEQGRAANWAALARAQKEGWVRDIGVSNL